jgi:AcrR family transcriptional regulator
MAYLFHMGKKSGRDTYHIKDLKRLLLRSVREELRDYGAAFASLRRIAKRAGASHAAPYRHFKGKDGLLAALCWEGQAEFTSRLKRARESAASPPEKLFKLGFAYLEYARSDPTVFQLMTSETGIRVMNAIRPEDPLLQRADYDSFDVLETTVKECQSAGTLDPGEDSGALAILIWSFIHGLALIRREGFLSSMGASRGLDGETTERLVMRAFRSMILGASGRAEKPS